MKLGLCGFEMIFREYGILFRKHGMLFHECGMHPISITSVRHFHYIFMFSLKIQSCFGHETVTAFTAFILGAKSKIMAVNAFLVFLGQLTF